MAERGADAVNSEGNRMGARFNRCDLVGQTRFLTFEFLWPGEFERFAEPVASWLETPLRDRDGEPRSVYRGDLVPGHRCSFGRTRVETREDLLGVLLGRLDAETGTRATTLKGVEPFDAGGHMKGFTVSVSIESGEELDLPLDDVKERVADIVDSALDPERAPKYEVDSPRP